MRLLLMATGPVGLDTFRYLRSTYPQDVAVVVSWQGDAVAREAAQAGLVALEVAPGDDVFARLMALDPDTTFDLGILAWWPMLIRRPLIGLPRHGFINFHPSLLPYNRGKHYNFWALVEQAPFGVTLHFVDESVDGGDIVAQAPIGYDWTDTGGTLYRKAQESIASLFQDTYPRLRSLQIPRRPQPAGGSLHLARELDPASRVDLDRSYTARELLNLLRARTFPGHPACYFYADDGVKYEVRVQITKATA